MKTHSKPANLAARMRWVLSIGKRESLYFLIDCSKAADADDNCVKVGSFNTCQSILADSEGSKIHLKIFPFDDCVAYLKSCGFPFEESGSTKTSQSETKVVDTVDEDEDNETDRSKAVEAYKRVTIGGKQASQAGANAIADMIQTSIEAALDVDGLKALAQDKLNEAVANLIKPTIVSIQPSPDAEPIPVGTVHNQFTKLLRACNSRMPDGHRLNVFLVGPAGTSKSTSAKQVATAMNLTYYPMSCIDSKFELFGFVDANGQTVRTAFREVWEHGGVFNFDEISGSSPQARLAFNGCLANGIAPFPDGAISRHPDCVIIAGDNVFDGPTAEYSAREKADAASADRWVVIDWPIDPVLERTITGDDAWVSTVQAFRQAVEDKGIRGILITPRASIYGASLIRAGFSKLEAAEMTMKKGMTQDQWNTVVRAVGLTG